MLYGYISYISLSQCHPVSPRERNVSSPCCHLAKRSQSQFLPGLTLEAGGPDLRRPFVAGRLDHRGVLFGRILPIPSKSEHVGIRMEERVVH